MAHPRTICTGSKARDGRPSDVTLWRESDRGWRPSARVAVRAPSWVVAHPTLPVLYGTQESEHGVVTSWPLEADGTARAQPRTWRPEGSGPHPERQRNPHAHAIYERGGELYAVDLGGDRIHLLPDDGPPWEALRLPPGFGPRHLAWDATRPGHAVVAGELDAHVALVDLGAHPRVLDIVPALTHAERMPS